MWINLRYLCLVSALFRMAEADAKDIADFKESFLFRRNVDGSRGRKYFNPEEDGSYDSYGSGGGHYNSEKIKSGRVDAFGAHDSTTRPVNIILGTKGLGFEDIRSNVPGEPGVDYPAYVRLPQTKFSCEGRAQGYYADEEVGCQVFHICHDVVVSSFLCPVGSVFNQQLLTCDWWNKVNCASTSSFYAVNDEIYKTDSEMVQKAYSMMRVAQDSRRTMRKMNYGSRGNDLTTESFGTFNTGSTQTYTDYSTQRNKNYQNDFRVQNQNKDSPIVYIHKINEADGFTSQGFGNNQHANIVTSDIQPSYAPTVPTVTTTIRTFYSPTVPTTYKPYTATFNRFDQEVEGSEHLQSQTRNDNSFTTEPTIIHQHSHIGSDFSSTTDLQKQADKSFGLVQDHTDKFDNNAHITEATTMNDASTKYGKIVQNTILPSTVSPVISKSSGEERISRKMIADISSQNNGVTTTSGLEDVNTVPGESTPYFFTHHGTGFPVTNTDPSLSFQGHQTATFSSNQETNLPITNAAPTSSFLGQQTTTFSSNPETSLPITNKAPASSFEGQRNSAFSTNFPTTTTAPDFLFQGQRASPFASNQEISPPSTTIAPPFPVQGQQTSSFSANKDTTRPPQREFFTAQTTPKIAYNTDVAYGSRIGEKASTQEPVQFLEKSPGDDVRTKDGLWSNGQDQTTVQQSRIAAEFTTVEYGPQSTGLPVRKSNRHPKKMSDRVNQESVTVSSNAYQTPVTSKVVAEFTTTEYKQPTTFSVNYNERASQQGVTSLSDSNERTAFPTEQNPASVTDRVGTTQGPPFARTDLSNLNLFRQASKELTSTPSAIKLGLGVTGDRARTISPVISPFNHPSTLLNYQNTPALTTYNSLSTDLPLTEKKGITVTESPITESIYGSTIEPAYDGNTKSNLPRNLSEIEASIDDQNSPYQISLTVNKDEDVNPTGDLISRLLAQHENNGSGILPDLGNFEIVKSDSPDQTTTGENVEAVSEKNFEQVTTPNVKSYKSGRTGKKIDFGSGNSLSERGNGKNLQNFENFEFVNRGNSPRPFSHAERPVEVQQSIPLSNFGVNGQDINGQLASLFGSSSTGAEMSALTRDQILGQFAKNFGQPLYHNVQQPYFGLPDMQRISDFRAGSSAADFHSDHNINFENSQRFASDVVETPKPVKTFVETELVPSVGFSFDTDEGRNEYVEAVLQGLLTRNLQPRTRGATNPK